MGTPSDSQRVIENEAKHLKVVTPLLLPSKNTDPQSSISRYCSDKKRFDGYLAVSEPAITFNIYDVNRKKDKRFAAVGKRYQPKTQ